ncbi:MAG: hypothetical protein KAI35_02355 [Desulfobulbaceae bacterium]|nr:hypothetical protein [Desulfobulbaceae bacterium]
MEKVSDLLYVFAKPALFFVLAIGFLFLIVKPFLRMLAESGVLTKKIDTPEESTDDFVGEADKQEAEDDFLDQQIMSSREKIARLAESSPDKAGDVVKKWIREEDEK